MHLVVVSLGQDDLCPCTTASCLPGTLLQTSSLCYYKKLTSPPPESSCAKPCPLDWAPGMLTWIRIPIYYLLSVHSPGLPLDSMPHAWIVSHQNSSVDSRLLLLLPPFLKNGLAAPCNSCRVNVINTGSCPGAPSGEGQTGLS